MAKSGQDQRMRRLVARWQRSDESGASFARRHGLAPWTFWYWQRKLTGTGVKDRSKGPVSLVPVQVVADETGGAIEIVLTSGDRVRVGAGAPVEVVRVVLAALRSA